LRLRTFSISFLIALLFCATAIFGSAAQAGTDSETIFGSVNTEQEAKLVSLQVPFVPNEGQLGNEQVKFYADTFAGTVFVTDDGITYALPNEDDSGWAIKEEFIGAKAFAPAAVSSSGVLVNYYTGLAQKSLSSYEEVTLGEVYDHINVNLRAYGNNVEKIFTVAPGGDPAAISVKVTGTDELSVNAQGELELATGLGTVKMTRPVAYQDINGQRVNVAVACMVENGGYGFQVGTYNQAYPLVIDPLLASTYLGGNNSDVIYTLALDAAGNVYVAGDTKSNDFPTVAGAYDQTYGGNSQPDAFVAKLSGDLRQLLAATYLGGTAADTANAIVLNSSGSVYITGKTKSKDFPATLVPYLGGGSDNDLFVAKLDGTHLGLIASTCLGGSGADSACCIALDSTSGNLFIAGQTSSANLNMTGYQPNIKLNAAINALVLKFSEDLSQVLAGTYIGGSKSDNLYALAIAPNGNVYIGGGTISNDYPCTDVAFKTSYSKPNTLTDGFVSMLSNDLSQLIASTYLGGITSSTNVRAIAFDSAGNVCVTGETAESDFPKTAGAYTGSSDAFVTKLKSDLTGPLVASSLFGGSTQELPKVIALDTSDNVYIAGQTQSIDYPFSTGAYQPARSGSTDAFVAKLSSDLSIPLLASTYLGGATSETAYGLALNAAGNVYIAGWSNSTNFPIEPSVAQVAQGTSGGATDSFIAKLTGDLAFLAADDTSAPIWPAGSLSVSDVVDNELTLTWSGAMDNLGVTGYKIYQDGTVIDTVDNEAAQSYKVTGLTAGTAYTFKVEAGDAAGYWSTDGPSKTVTTAVSGGDASAPTWPVGSALTPSNIAETGLTLTWTPAEDDTAVAGYKIFKDNVEIAFLNGAAYSYDVTGLAVNNHYAFKVEAGDASGNWSIDGPGTTADTVLTSDTIPPFWPGSTNLTRNSVDSSSVLLTWTPAQDNVGVTGYKVYKEGVEIATVDASTTEYIATGLANRVSYLFSIEAFDGSGNLSNSGPYIYAAAGGLYLDGAYLTGISGDSPASTTGPAIEGSSSVPLSPMFLLNFSNNVVKDQIWTNNQSKVVLQDGSGNNVPVNVTRIPDTINFNERNNVFVSPLAPLTASTQYKLIIVKGFIANNESTLGVNREISFTTEAAASGSPAWPSGGTMTASNQTASGVTLAWTPADAGAGVNSYIMIKDNSDIVKGMNGTVANCDVTGLTAGTTYNFRVQAFNSATNWSSDGPSATVTTTIPDTSTPVWNDGSLSASNVSQASVDLSWSVATDNVGVTGYRIYKDAALIDTVSGATNTYNFTELEPGTQYNFQVQAGDAAGNWSSDGPSINATTLTTGGEHANITRLAGVNRVETAGAIAANLYPAGADTVIIAESRKMADSMIGTLLAGVLDAPIILADRQTDLGNYSILKGQIASLSPTKVYLLGASSVVSDDIYNYLQAQGYTVKRIAGDDRFDTAVEIIKEAKNHASLGSTLYITNGRGQTDANGLMLAAEGFAIAPSADVAGKFNPVLLIDKNWTTAEKAVRVNTLIDNAGLTSLTNCIILGDTTQVPKAVENVLTAKLSGAAITRQLGDVYTISSNLAVAYANANSASGVVIARGDILADALAGGLLAAKQNAPLIFVNTDSLPTPANNAINTIVNVGSKAYILGSNEAVSDYVVEAINQIIVN